jgi:hypothetical protein
VGVLNPVSQKRQPGKELCGKLDAGRDGANPGFPAQPACRGWKAVTEALYWVKRYFIRFIRGSSEKTMHIHVILNGA